MTMKINYWKLSIPKDRKNKDWKEMNSTSEIFGTVLCIYVMSVSDKGERENRREKNEELIA